MIIMGVDFGDARTGLAVCDKGEMLASPAGVISEKDFTRCQEKVAAAAKEHRAELLVVGYPKNMNGTVGERAELCQKFGDGLKELTGLPVVMWDERCTTVSAHSYLNVTNTRGKKRKAVVDAVRQRLFWKAIWHTGRIRRMPNKKYKIPETGFVPVFGDFFMAIPHNLCAVSPYVCYMQFSTFPYRDSLRCMGICSAPSFSRFS